MTGWLPDGALEWQGRSVARSVAAASPRSRAVLVGRVQEVAVRHVPSAPGPAGLPRRGASFDAVLDDGTGSIVVRWVGRDAVPGVRAGVTMRVEGTVAEVRGRLMLLNPLYRFEDPGPSSNGSTPAAHPAQDGSSVSW